MEALNRRKALVSDNFLIGASATEDLPRAYGMVTAQVQLIEEIVSCDLIQEELNDEAHPNLQ